MEFQITLCDSQFGIFRVAALAAARTLANKPNGSDDLRPLQDIVFAWEKEAKSTKDLLFLKLVWYLFEEIQHDMLDRLWVENADERLRSQANQVAQALIRLAQRDQVLRLEDFFELAEMQRRFMATVSLIEDSPPATP